MRKIRLFCIIIMLLSGININAKDMYVSLGGLYTPTFAGSDVASFQIDGGNSMQFSNYKSNTYGGGVYFGLSNRYLYQMGLLYKFKQMSFDYTNISRAEFESIEINSHILAIPISFGLNFLYFEKFSMGISVGGSFDFMLSNDDYKICDYVTAKANICVPAFICGLEIHAPYCWVNVRYQLKGSDYTYKYTYMGNKVTADMPLFHGVEIAVGVNLWEMK